MSIFHSSITKSFLLISATAMLFSCGTKSETAKNQLQKQPFYAPEWSKNAVIYEVNVRQYSQESSFKAVTSDIPRLKNLGVDVLWLMPINPIGIEKRKGTLGSYYSVKDYQGVNPEFGNLNDFKQLVKTAHDNGLKVIIDWVANHSAWDNLWMQEHPEWYERDSSGNVLSPFDWTDVAKLNYNDSNMRKAMINALEYWVKETDIDGYRCDVAFMVPADFWRQARASLEKIKPVFMLAEMESETQGDKTFKDYYSNAFNANYSWHLHALSAQVAQGKKTAQDFKSGLKYNYGQIPSDVFKMQFLTNHDENTWNGTVEEKYGKHWKLFSVLNYTLPQSFPLIYNGEEENNTKRLLFFEKDPIKWGDTSRYHWYRQMNHLKHIVPAIANGKWGSPMKEINLDDISKDLLAFDRVDSEGHGVRVVVNLGNTSVTIPKGKIVTENPSLFAYDNMEFDDQLNANIKGFGFVVIILN